MNIAVKILFFVTLISVAVARKHDDDSSEMEENDRRPQFDRRPEGGFMRHRERKPDSEEDDRDEAKRRPPFERDDSREDSEEERPRPRDRENEDDDNKEMRDRPMRRPWFMRRRMTESREGDEDRFSMRSRRPFFEHMFGSRDEQSPRFGRHKGFRRPEMDENDDEEERRPRMRRFRPRFESEEDDDEESRNEMRESRDDDEDDESEDRWSPRHHRRHGRHGRHGRFPPCHRRRHYRRHHPWMSWSRDGDEEDQREMHRNMMMRMFMFHRMMQMRRQMEQNKDDNTNIYGSRFWRQPQFYPQQQSNDNQQTQYSQYPPAYFMAYLNRQGMSLAGNNENSNNNNQNSNSPLPPPPGINLAFQSQGASNPGQTFFGSTQGRPLLQINEMQVPQGDNNRDMDTQNMVPSARDQDQPLPEPPGIAISTTTQSSTTDEIA